MRRHVVTWKCACLVAVVALHLASGDAVLQTQNFANSSEESLLQQHPISIITTDNITFSLPRLAGEKVTIWNDPIPGRRYYFPPSIIPDWGKFAHDHSELCGQVADEVRVNIGLLISLSDQHYEREIRRKLWQPGNKEDLISEGLIPEHELNALPHDNIQILLRENSALPPRLLYDRRERSRMTNEEGTLSHPLVRYRRDITVSVVGTCESLTSLLDLALKGEDLLEGKIYIAGIQYQTTSFWGQLNMFLANDRSLVSVWRRDLRKDTTLSKHQRC